MCEPVTLALLALAVGGAGVATQAYAANEAGNAAGDQADAQARALQESARQDREAAAEDAQKLQTQRVKVQGAARAAIAAGGADLSRGAPVTIEQDIYGRSQSDIEAVLKSGKRRSDISSLEAAGYSESAGGYRRGGALAAGGTLLAGGSSLLAQSRQYQQARAKPGWMVNEAP